MPRRALKGQGGLHIRAPARKPEFHEFPSKYCIICFLREMRGKLWVMKTPWTYRYTGAALVTGASSGLGEAFARLLASRGTDVVLVARRKGRLKSLATELRSRYGVQVWIVDQDLSATDAAAQVKARLDALGVEVGLLINNAGAGSHGAFHHASVAEQLHLVDVNCRALVAMAAEFLPPMAARGNGGVIFVSSTCAPLPVPKLATYGATKAFATSFGQAVAADMAGTGVDVLTFAPGYIRTEFHQVAGIDALPHAIQWNDPVPTAEAALAGLGGPTYLRYGATVYSYRQQVLSRLRIVGRKLLAITAAIVNGFTAGTGTPAAGSTPKCVRQEAP